MYRFYLGFIQASFCGFRSLMFTSHYFHRHRVRIDPKHIRKTIYAKTGNTFAASVIVSGLE